MIAGPSQNRAQRPDCPSVTIFRTRSFVPSAIITEEVSKPAVGRIEPMLQKGQITGREPRNRQMWFRPLIFLRLIFLWLLFLSLTLAHALQHHRENQCT